jgi:ABC-type multidrug transport system fused ATPase/permease subunit
MGLLQPTDGTLAIDGQPVTTSNNRAWQAHIAHVPQAIYLSDSTIEENIAFGIPKGKIDHNRVKRAAQQAQIAEIIESWPKSIKLMLANVAFGSLEGSGSALALHVLSTNRPMSSSSTKPPALSTTRLNRR